MKDLICVKTYTNRVEAELAKGFLKTSSIEAIVSADDCGGVRPELGLGTGGVRLLVKKEDIQRALKVLENSNKSITPPQYKNGVKSIV